jgi:outer membrane protein assembly factor BamB
MMYFVRRLTFCLLACCGAALANADEWPQWRGPDRDGVWKEDGLVDRFANPQLKIRWQADVASGYSGPTVAGGRVYVTDRLVEPTQRERVLCFDWETGKPLWNHTYDSVYVEVGYTAGPRAAVTVDDGRAYSLGTMGHLFCFDAATGQILWKHQLVDEYKVRMPIWGLASAPLVEQDLLIVQCGGENACLVAFDKRTGAERWRALDDRASYSSPIMIQQAGRRVLVCWTGDNVVGLNPQTGETYWKEAFKPTRMVIGIATPVVDRDRLFVSCFYDGSMMLKLNEDRPAAELLWRRLGPDEQHTDSLHAMIGTPWLIGGYIYGVDSYGQLRCLEADTGNRVWESLKAVPKTRWATIHMVRNGDRMWMFNERGMLIIAKLSPAGYEEISRAKLLDPTSMQLNQRGGVCWSHPAFAYRHVFARSDEKLVCASLAACEN